MPNGDGTGPYGAGRGWGCRGWRGRGFGCRYGGGFGGGYGRGMWMGAYPVGAQPGPAEDAESLKAYARELEAELEAVKKRIASTGTV